ncbi:hypothetical protein [Priestia flexa]|uniref:hypothetical protein n=1 Tax=Priestia flexa TaxID=86664 RepID=UPI003D027E39
MITQKEQERLQMIVKYLEHQELANQYHNQILHQMNQRTSHPVQGSSIDVSNRDRDLKGRFLPYDYPTEELSSTFDKEVDVRHIVLKPIKGSYNSYTIDEKKQRDWSGNVYLSCFVIILAIAFFT